MALAPENTLAAFGRATALGLTYLETDVHTTRDGHVVCFHDSDLRRVTGHPGRVADLDLADLRRLRVHGTEQIPTLAEAMGTFARTRFAIDLKDEASIAPMARLLRANPRWAERVLRRRRVEPVAEPPPGRGARRDHGARLALADHADRLLEAVACDRVGVGSVGRRLRARAAAARAGCRSTPSG